MSQISDYPALRKPRLRGGVGARTATLIWSVVTMAAVVIGLPWGLAVLPLGAIAHGGLKWLFQQDHRIVDLYLVHEAVPNNLHAGYPSHGERASSRPKGYARHINLQ